LYSKARLLIRGLASVFRGLDVAWRHSCWAHGRRVTRTCFYQRRRHLSGMAALLNIRRWWRFGGLASCGHVATA